MVKSLRKSNLELLRIISMILIVMSHCDDIFGLYSLYRYTLGINKLITDWLHIGGQIGVGCFLLISGYFMVDQKITAKKIIKTAGVTWFYSIGIWFIWIVFIICSNSVSDVGLTDILKNSMYSLFPIVFSHYWFVTAYIILMIFSPFLNKFIASMNKKEYSALLIALIAIFVVIGCGFPLALLGEGMPSFLSGMFDGRLIPVFIVYFVAGYIRKFGNPTKKNAPKHIFIAILFYILLFFSAYIITYLGNRTDNRSITALCYYYRVLNSPLIMVISVELFIGFTKLDISYNPFINLVAGSTFGVYLIHSNCIAAQIFLPALLPIYKEDNSLLLFLYSVLGVVALYVCCTLIELLRQRTVDKLWMHYLDTRFCEQYQIILRGAKFIWAKAAALLTQYYN